MCRHTIAMSFLFVLALGNLGLGVASQSATCMFMSFLASVCMFFVVIDHMKGS